jgi:hypothetical protein
MVSDAVTDKKDIKNFFRRFFRRSRCGWRGDLHN